MWKTRLAGRATNGFLVRRVWSGRSVRYACVGQARRDTWKLPAKRNQTHLGVIACTIREWYISADKFVQLDTE